MVENWAGSCKFKHFHQFLVIESWLKLVQEYLLSCTWESCNLGGLSRRGIADSLEIRGSACNVSEYCIHMSKNNIYKLWFEFWRSNIYSSILTLGTSFSIDKRVKIWACIMFNGSATCNCWGQLKFN